MNTIAIIRNFVIAAAIAGSSVNSHADENTDQAIKAAKSWLELVDAGEYVVIQFKTSFADKPDSVETITPMKDEKGVWRVSGYFIK